MALEEIRTKYLRFNVTTAILCPLFSRSQLDYWESTLANGSRWYITANGVRNGLDHSGLS